jgi:hypothetical protein
MPSIPSAIGTDAEDVVWALQTADALWKREERIDAIVWLRRAAQAAGEAEDDDRALALARNAAELAEWIARNPTPRGGAPRTPPPTSAPAPARDDVDDLLSVPPEEVEFEEPTPVKSIPAVSIVPSFPAPSMPPSRGRVPTAAEAHAGILDPWAEGEAPTQNGAADDTQRAQLPSLPVPEFEGDEVVTSAPMVAAPSIGTSPVLPPSLPANILPIPPATRSAPRVGPPPLPPEPAGAKPPERAPPKKGAAPPRPATARTTDAAPASARTPEPARFPTPEPARVGKLTPEAKPVVEARAAPRAQPPREPATGTATAPAIATETATAPALDLSHVEALSDLPDDARAEFASAATVTTLARDDEASGFALALVLEGSVDVSATIVDAAAQRLEAGAVLRARGTIDAVSPIRLVGAAAESRVATWDEDAVTAAFRTCPWVEDELRAAGDLHQALIGITMGPLGERLDSSLRSDVASRLKLRALAEHEVIATRGDPVPGLVVVGAGELELLDEQGAPNGARVGAGEFLFASEALRAARTPNTVRAARGGALVLMAGRGATQELLMTFPPLLEIFAGM